MLMSMTLIGLPQNIAKIGRCENFLFYRNNNILMTYSNICKKIYRMGVSHEECGSIYVIVLNINTPNHW